MKQNAKVNSVKVAMKRLTFLNVLKLFVGHSRKYTNTLVDPNRTAGQKTPLGIFSIGNIDWQPLLSSLSYSGETHQASGE